MSVKVIGLVWDYYPAGGGELLTALKIADHADHDGGRVYPSVASLAYYTQQSERTVQRQLRAMEDNGWLVLVKETSGRPGETRRYRVPVELIPQGVVVRVTDCHPSGGVTGEAGTGDKPSTTGDIALSPKPSLTSTVSNTTVKPLAQPAGRASFEIFWKAYPKKRSKGQAERAWAKMAPGPLVVDLLLQALERAKASADWKKEGGQFIPYPATWLNAKGWEDEIDDRPITPCWWPGCRSRATATRGSARVCEQHLNALNRGETP